MDSQKKKHDNNKAAIVVVFVCVCHGCGVQHVVNISTLVWFFVVFQPIKWKVWT